MDQNKSLRLSKSVIDQLEFGSQSDYYDKDLKGFGVRVGKHSKTFFVRRYIKGRYQRITLGRYGVLTPRQARNLAIEALSDMGQNIDINAEKAKRRERGTTVQEILDKYLIIRHKLKTRTIETYRNLFSQYLSDWLSIPIEHITKDMVLNRHIQIATDHGKAAADNALRTFRAIYNFANGIMNDTLGVNPVKILTNIKQWYHVRRRQTYIQSADLPEWYAAVNRLSNPVVCDYLLLLLFTGARCTEMASMKWNEVNLERKTFTFIHTKNGNPLQLPMSDMVYTLFRRRAESQKSDFVFPGNGRKGHIINTKRQIMKIKDQTGVAFCLHDLRRTFAVAASSIAGVYELKRLLNHAVSHSDVTEGYLVFDVERLRLIVQSVTNHLKELCMPQPLPPGYTHIIPFRQKAS